MFQRLSSALVPLSPGAQGSAAQLNKVWAGESASGQEAQNSMRTRRTEVHRLRKGQLEVFLRNFKG